MAETILDLRNRLEDTSTRLQLSERERTRLLAERDELERRGVVKGRGGRRLSDNSIKVPALEPAPAPAPLFMM